MNFDSRRADEEVGKLVSEARALLESAEGKPESEVRAAHEKHDALLDKVDSITALQRGHNERMARVASYGDKRDSAREDGVREAVETDGIEARSSVEKRLQAQERKLEEMAERMGAVSLRDGVETVIREDQKQSIVRGFLGGLLRAYEGEKFAYSDADVEACRVDLQRQQEKYGRAQTTGTAATGGNLVPKVIYDEVVVSLGTAGPLADPNLVHMIMTPDGSDLGIPTSDQSAAAGGWLGENAAASDANITFGQKVLKGPIISSNLVLVPQTLLQDSGVLWDYLVNTVFEERIYHSLNAGLTGTGAGAAVSNGPANPLLKDMRHASGNARPTVAGKMQVEHVTEAIFNVDPRYRARPSFRVMIPDGVLKFLRTAKVGDSDSRYVWEPGNLAAGLDANLFGFRYVINNDIPATPAAGNISIVAGDFQRFAVRQVRGFMLRVLTERYAEKFQVGFVGFGRFDGTVTDPQAFYGIEYR